MTVDVRRLGAREWKLWRELRLRALADSPRAFGSVHAVEVGLPARVWKERTAAAASSPDRAIFVASDKGKWVGCIGVFAVESEPATVFSMWVEPDFRRRGVARQLLDAVRDWALTRGERQLRLMVVRDQHAAVALYHSYGFCPTGRSAPMERDPSILEDEMALSLQSSPPSMP